MSFLSKKCPTRFQAMDIVMMIKDMRKSGFIQSVLQTFSCQNKRCLELEQPV